MKYDYLYDLVCCEWETGDRLWGRVTNDMKINVNEYLDGNEIYVDPAVVKQPSEDEYLDKNGKMSNSLIMKMGIS